MKVQDLLNLQGKNAPVFMTPFGARPILLLYASVGTTPLRVPLLYACTAGALTVH